MVFMSISRRSFVKKAIGTAAGLAAVNVEIVFAGDAERAKEESVGKEKSKEKSDGKFKAMAVQFCGKVGQWEENLRGIANWSQKAAAKDCDLVLFPELAITGYTSKKELVAKTAQTVPGPATDKLLEMAKANDLAISAGITEKAKGKYHITQVTALPDGNLHVYRKRFGGEPNFTWGEPVEPFSFRGLKIGVVICMDARIYELYREYAYAGTNLILKPNSAWQGPWLDGDPETAKRAEADRKVMEVGWESDSYFAATNGMAMICCNTVGDTGNSVYPGGCWYSDGGFGVKESIKLESRKDKLAEQGLIGQFDIAKFKEVLKDIQGDLDRARYYYDD